MSVVQVDARVTLAEADGPYRRVHLHAPALAARLAPGQFVTAELGHLLRHPLLPCAVTAQELQFLLPGASPVELALGQTVDLLGPVGCPLDLPQPSGRLLLLADAGRLPALLFAAHQALHSGLAVALLLALENIDELYPPSRLPPELEVHVATADGSAGHTASLAQLLNGDGAGQLQLLLRWADRLLAAVDPALYPPLADSVRAGRIGPSFSFAQVLLLPPIVCGVGACRGCAVSTTHGYRLACSEGPFFDLLTLEGA